MSCPVTAAKRRASAAQKARLEKRVAELPQAPSSKAEPTCQVTRRGHRTYYTFEGTLAATAAAAKAALKNYTWAGPNPYSPWTEDPVDIGGGKVRIVASHCSSVE